MAESLKRVISGKKLGSVFMPSSPMTTHYKRAAAAPAVSEAEIEFPGEQLNQGNIDAPHASSFVIPSTECPVHAESLHDPFTYITKS